jgi:hypothetical protein
MGVPAGDLHERGVHGRAPGQPGARPDAGDGPPSSPACSARTCWR